MIKKNRHVVPLGTGWAVKRAGHKGFDLISQTKQDALDFAKQLAKNSKAELIVHGRDGKIQRKDSFIDKK